jgi:hypothetical protein
VVAASEGPAGTAFIAAGRERVWVLSERGSAVELPGTLAADPAWIVAGESVRLVLSRRVPGGRSLELQDVQVGESAVLGAARATGPYACVVATSLVDADGGLWVVGLGRAGEEHRLAWSDMARPGWSHGSPVADDSGKDAVAMRWVAASRGCILAAVGGVVVCADVDTGDTVWYPPKGHAGATSLRDGTYLTDATSAEIVVLRIREESE